MTLYNGWEIIGEPLGRGGQGTVYKARSPERAKALESSIKRIEHELRQVNGVNSDSLLVPDLVKRIVDAGGPDPVQALGALKVFQIPNHDPAEREKSIARLQAEMKALRELTHPNVLRFLDGSHLDADAPFIVSEYHSKGTLHDHISTWAGKALEALLAFRPLVEAIVAIHQKGAIHRDIKLKNIFLGDDGSLTLGDFGIVFFVDGDRMTETYERAGSRDWMAPWANVEHRLALEDLNPTLDIFPLGKILWCMVSGRRSLRFWYFNHPAKGSMPANNLEQIFPNDPAMSLVNGVLARCIVEDEEHCLKAAADLLVAVDKAIAEIQAMGRKKDDATPWLCQVCRKGHYQVNKVTWRAGFANAANNNQHETLQVFFCDNCGHAEFFRRPNMF